MVPVMIRTIAILMVLAMLVQPSLAQIGTTFCICSPSSYNITFDFTKNCDDTNLQPSEAVVDSACIIEPLPNNPAVTDLVPVSVRGVLISELDQNLQIMGQIVPFDGLFENGDSLAFSSISSDAAQVSEAAFPRALQITAQGRNAAGEALVFVMVIFYNTDCVTLQTLSEGSTIGWITFADQQDPLYAVCPRPTASPSMVPTIFPSGAPTWTPTSMPTDFPSTSPTQSPSATPTMQPSASPTASPTVSAPFFCFSGETTVEVQGRGVTRMDQLKIGDMVRSGNGSLTAVYSFGHYAPNVELEFLQIETDMHQAPLEITGDHMVFTMEAILSASSYKMKKSVPVPARDIQVGDCLLLDGQDQLPEALIVPQRVTAIRKVQRRGAFAPFTLTGDIVVNDVVVSNYIVLPSTFQQAGLSFEHQHWFQHIVYAPYRLYCQLAEDGCEHERYDEETGLSKVVLFWLPALEWMESQDPDTLSFFLFVVALAFSCVLLGLVHILVDNVWKILSLIVKVTLFSSLLYFIVSK